MSLPFWWPDEFAFILYNKVIYNSATPALSKATEIAENKGSPHSKIFTTTPSNTDIDSGAFCKFLIDLACPFVVEMYDWDRESILEFLQTNSTNNLFYIKYTWQELGLSPKWYEKQCRELNNDWLTINREVNLHWTKSSDNSVFKEEQLEEINRLIRPSIGNMFVDVTHKIVGEPDYIGKYAFTMYDELVAEKQYAIGVDVAGGLDNDNSAISILDPEDRFKLVGVFKSPVIDTNQLSFLIIELINTKLSKSIVFIENNSYGKGVIDNVIKVIKNNVYTYFSVSKENLHKNNINKDSSNGIVLGIPTSTSTRPRMMEILRELVENSPDILGYSELYDDVKGLVYNKGKIEHGSNLHDDVLMSTLIVRYAFAHTNNIHKYFKDLGSKERSSSDDPAKNLGEKPDFSRILELINLGMSPEAAVDAYKQEVTKSSQRKVANKILVKQLLVK